MGSFLGSFCSIWFSTPVDYFSLDEVRDYRDCTYFSEVEINKLYQIFSSINRQKLDQNCGDSTTRLSFDEVKTLPALKECPFIDRLLQVFTTDIDKEGINFEDFLDMISALSHRAPWSLKAAYAFQIFDFNEDTRICLSDIENAVKCLTAGGSGIEESDMKKIVNLILKEIGAGDSSSLTYTEFEHMLATAPDFSRLFRIPLV